MRTLHRKVHRKVQRKMKIPPSTRRVQRLSIKYLWTTVYSADKRVVSTLSRYPPAHFLR